MPSVELIVPWRGGCEHRARALAYLRERYLHDLDLVPVLAPGPTPWVKAEAVTPAVESSTAEVLIVADADVWAAGIPEALKAIAAGAPWAMPHRGVSRLTEDSTAQLLADPSTDPETCELEERTYRGYIGGGCAVLRRDAYFAAPLDPRFVGWGDEDFAWGRALTTLLGPPERVRRPLLHLWHPPQPRAARDRGSAASRALARRYQAAGGNPAAMQALIEEFAPCRSRA